MNSIRIKKYFIILGIPFIFQACFVAKEYQRPEEVVLEEDLFRTNILLQDTTSMAEVSWREMFTDPLLITYIEQGLNNNIDIRVAVQQIAAAEAYVKQGKAGYFPTLGLGTSVNHQILSRNSQFGSFFDGSITQYEATGNLSWEADIWGKIRSNDRAFQASYLQTAAAHQAVKTELIASIASMYYQLLALDKQLEITLETIETRESSLETTKALKEAGTVTEVAVKQTEAQLYRARAVVVDIENNIRLLENAFSILLGDTPHDIERSDLARQQITTELQAGVPGQMLRNRPDVIAAEYNLINAFELTNVARGSFYPSIRLTASGGFQSLDIAELFNANSLFANLVGSLAQPLLNQRRIRTQYEVAQAQQQIALLDFKRSLLVASREVSDALYNYEAAVKKIELKSEEYGAYELATNYSEELLNNGLANYLEVLNAQENALNSQLELVTERFNRLDAIVELYQALGGGWR
ncbi:efflux transporter outer membrane subunit [Gillisia limnaea]|uniref:RND efflux system, outer membrane lipoprotein, NodT family n=1 Tax=Gillisia limnaea (strain DSM 15749 / LMG 21470 / R-8282) TaxID=865937 RepID=H2BT31_GILLR|nr:efflux transporter outer membrane subunit [Gillisia limnaea]EHQ02589.1 RND efflux system, outer membrane lipoprotein, NodT family [Gillisia limnaea DSM 15749]